MPSKIAALFAALKPAKVPEAWRAYVLLLGTFIIFAGIATIVVSTWRQPLSGDVIAAAGLIIGTGLVVLWSGAE